MVESIPPFSGSTVLPERASILSTTDEESSGDSTADFTKESIITETTISSKLSTESPSVTPSGETETSGTLKQGVTAASSLYSTEKPTSVSTETQETATTRQTEKLSSTPETSSTFPKIDEESSGEQTTEISSGGTAASTASSLFSTEKPTGLPVIEHDSAATSRTENPSVTPFTGKVEESSVVTTVYEDGSGDQTQEMFTQTYSVTAKSSLYSTEAPTTASPVTSPTFLDSEEEGISSETTMVESIPPLSGSTMLPERASFLSATDEESSGDSTAGFTKESIITETTISSKLSTESPSVTPSGETETSGTLKQGVTAASSLYSTEKPTSVSTESQETATTRQTEKLSSTPETSSTFPKIDEESSGEQTTEISSDGTAASTASSLFSTEKPTGLPVIEHDSAATSRTENPSVTPLTGKVE
ncbi:uncharacterized protein LOC127376128, partial [Dicentrarchus labrax]